MFGGDAGGFVTVGGRAELDKCGVVFDGVAAAEQGGEFAVVDSVDLRLNLSDQPGQLWVVRGMDDDTVQAVVGCECCGHVIAGHCRCEVCVCGAHDGQRAGLLTRRKLPKPAAVWVYELTDWARELEPVMQLLGRWAARDPNHRKDLHFGVASLILSLRTNFDAALADGANLTIGLHPHDESYTACVARRKLTITRGVTVDPDATIAGDPRAFAAVIYGGCPLTSTITAGDLDVTGDRAAAEQFLSLYTLPPAVDVPTTEHPQIPTRSA